MIDYDPRNWYWSINGDATRVYSGASGSFVPVADQTFVAWIAAGNQPSHVPAAADLGAVLALYRMRPVDAAVLAAYQSALASSVDLALGRVLFNHENRIRVLEARAQVSAQQFTAAIAALL